MATYDNTRPMADGHLFGVRLNKFFGAIAAWNDARVTRNALMKLSDHELDDLGLHRGDIEAMSSTLRRY